MTNTADQLELPSPLDTMIAEAEKRQQEADEKFAREQEESRLRRREDLLQKIAQAMGFPVSDTLGRIDHVFEGVNARWNEESQTWEAAFPYRGRNLSFRTSGGQVNLYSEGMFIRGVGAHEREPDRLLLAISEVVKGDWDTRIAEFKLKQARFDEDE